MPTRAETIGAVAPLIVRYLAVRVEALRKKAIGVLNVNSFLVRSVRSALPMESQSDLASFAFYPNLAHGLATAFGRLVDEKMLPSAFGTFKLNKPFRAANAMSASHFDDIDHVVHRRDGEFLLSLKAGAWTIQHTQSMGMYENFKRLGDLGLRRDGVVVGVYYGHAGSLTNKYDNVRGVNARHQASMTPLPYVRVYAGREFWAWLNNDEPETEEWVLEGIAKGSDDFGRQFPELKAWLSEGPVRLRDALRELYGLPDDDGLDFMQLLNAVNSPLPSSRVSGALTTASSGEVATPEAVADEDDLSEC